MTPDRSIFEKDQDASIQVTRTQWHAMVREGDTEVTINGHPYHLQAHHLGHGIYELTL